MKTFAFIEDYPLPSASADGFKGKYILALPTGIWVKDLDSGFHSNH